MLILCANLSHDDDCVAKKWEIRNFRRGQKQSKTKFIRAFKKTVYATHECEMTTRLCLCYYFKRTWNSNLFLFLSCQLQLELPLHLIILLSFENEDGKEGSHLEIQSDTQIYSLADFSMFKPSDHLSDNEDSSFNSKCHLHSFEKLVQITFNISVTVSRC